MKVKKKDLQLNDELEPQLSKKLGLFTLKLDLPPGFEITGYTFNNEIKIRRNQGVSNN